MFKERCVFCTEAKMCTIYCVFFTLSVVEVIFRARRNQMQIKMDISGLFEFIKKQNAFFTHTIVRLNLRESFHILHTFV